MAAKTGKTPKAEPEVAAAKKKAGKTPSAPAAGTEIVVISDKALSVDVGPMVIGALSAAYDVESKANAMLAEVDSKRYDSLAKLTQACVKAAKADPSIDLSVTFKDDKKLMNKLNDQLGLALGFREVFETEINGEIRKKIGTAKAVIKFFPGAKEKKDTDAYRKKATLRSNFLHMIKKCAQTASAIVAKDIDVKQDKESGTLLLTGPAIKAKYGEDSVLLNEKLTVGSGDDAKKLKEKPSFTSIAKMGAEAAGKTLTTRKDSRVASGAVDPNLAIISLCNSLIEGMGKLKDKPDAKAIEALKKAQTAIAEKLKA